MIAAGCVSITKQTNLYTYIYKALALSHRLGLVLYQTFPCEKAVSGHDTVEIYRDLTNLSLFY